MSSVDAPYTNVLEDESETRESQCPCSQDGQNIRDPRSIVSHRSVSVPGVRDGRGAVRAEGALGELES